MPKYSVIMTRDATESATVEIEADSPEEAERLAREKPRYEIDALKWELDENADPNVYVTDCTEADDEPAPE